MPENFENLENEGQEGVVDPQIDDIDDDVDADEYEDDDVVSDDEDDSDDLEEDEDEEEGENDYEVADRKQSKQSKEENAIYAKLRRKAEEEARSKYERERQALEQERQAYLQEKQLKESITEEAIWNKADELGVTEDVARMLLEKEHKLAVYEQERQRRAYEATLDRHIDQYKDWPNFDLYKSEIKEAAMRNPEAFNFEVVYDYIHGRNARQNRNNEINTVKKRTEKRIIADIQDRAKRSGVQSTGASKADIDYRQHLDQSAIEMARAMGVPPERVAKYVVKNKKSKRKG